MRKYIVTGAMNPYEAISSNFSNVFDFQGRARRSEFWWNAPLMIFLFFLGFFLIVMGVWYSFIAELFFTLLFLAVTVRRVHDSGHSGLWVYLSIMASTVCNIYGFVLGITQGMPSDEVLDKLVNPIFIGLGIVSVICTVITFIFCFMDSEKKLNKFGESPKYIPQDDMSPADLYTMQLF